MNSVMDLVFCDTRGFPIRKSAGRWIFAPNRSLSQLVTSFVGSQCQGILLVLFLAWPLCLNLLELFEIVCSLNLLQLPIIIFHISVSFDTSLLSQCISSIQFSKYILGFAKHDKNTLCFCTLPLGLYLIWTYIISECHISNFVDPNHRLLYQLYRSGQ